MEHSQNQKLHSQPHGDYTPCAVPGDEERARLVDVAFNPTRNKGGGEKSKRRKNLIPSERGESREHLSRRALDWQKRPTPQLGIRPPSEGTAHKPGKGSNKKVRNREKKKRGVLKRK